MTGPLEDPEGAADDHMRSALESDDEEAERDCFDDPPGECAWPLDDDHECPLDDPSDEKGTHPEP